MKILLTGCAGFIGAKVAEMLLKDGVSVIGVDNLNDYYDPELKNFRLKQLELPWHPPVPKAYPCCKQRSR